MRKLLYILPVLLILGFAACELCRTGVIIRRLLHC